MAYINVEEEKIIYEDDWLLRKNFIFDMASFQGLYEINDLIIESNDLLKKSALGGISYTDQSDAIKKSDGQIFTIYSFIGEVFGKMQECIDEPLYTGFNTGATFYLGNVKIEEYTTANTLGLTESTTDGVNGAFLLKEKEELNLEDFLLGNLNGNMADYEYYSMFSKLYKEDCKNFGVNDYVRDEYLDGEFCTDGMMNYMGCVDDILTAGEYIHKKDNPWYVDFLKFEASFLIEPIYEAIVGREMFSGEKLTDTERSMAGIKAMLDAGAVLDVGGVVLEETLLIGGKQVVIKTLSKKEYQKVLDQALKEKNGYKVITSESGTRLIPGTEGIVTGGNSTKLGKNMLEDMGVPQNTKWTTYQAQHVIPAEMSDHPVLQKIGMDMDDASNGLFLRTPAEDISTMSRHRGYHSIYNEFVRSQLDKIDVSQNIDILQKNVFDLQSNLKVLQQSGLPLYPSQGATVELWERSLIRIK